LARETLAQEAKGLIDRIAAEPRAAGSQAESRSRAMCARILADEGFAVREEEFVYSAFPGHWAVPLLGLFFLAWFAYVGSQVGYRPHGAVSGTLPFMLLLPALAYMLARMTPAERLMGRKATNLVATRGERPAVWLVAHLDTKSQPVPMLGRIAGIVTVSLAFPVVVLAGFVDRGRDWPDLFWYAVTGAGALGAGAMLLSMVGNRSRGAIDNASGVAAVLLVASRLPQEMPAAVLLTSGEELGLAGAKAWVRHRSVKPGRAVNFDGLDDVGTLTCMAKRTSRLAARLRSACEADGARMRFRRVLPGIMVDALALGAAGWDAVTVSKGNFSTLARIHTAGDVPERLAGSGVAEAVELVTNFIKRET